MNIILKAFDGEYCKQFLERAFQGLHIDTCINIANHQKQWPDLDVDEHTWHPAEPLRAGQYPDVDWSTITPLDEELIEKMRHCETTFLTMVDRYARYGDIPYEERRQQYLRHLRYWNHILETKKINLFVQNTVAHQCYDLVIYDLCKLKGIPTLYIERCYIVDAFLFEEDWETAGKEIGERFAQLKEQFSDPNAPVELSKRWESYFESHTNKQADPWYMFRRSKHLEKKSFVSKWCGTALKMLIRKPFQLIKSIVSPQFWSRKLEQHRITQLYDKYTKVPDFSKPYIYVPLHLQPEATTCPLSGVFTNQELIVQMIARCIPDEVSIYVKEHPAQGELCRSKSFYESLQEISSVTLVPRTFDTFQLTDNAIAVATGTGTAGFEALFREKPVLMFGHRFYQYAPGIHRIRTIDDCKDAVDSIVSKKEKPTLHDMRLFLKAMEETTTPYVGGPDSELEPYTKEQKAEMMGAKMAEKLRPLFQS